LKQGPLVDWSNATLLVRPYCATGVIVDFHHRFMAETRVGYPQGQSASAGK